MDNLASLDSSDALVGAAVDGAQSPSADDGGAADALADLAVMGQPSEEPAPEVPEIDERLSGRTAQAQLQQAPSQQTAKLVTMPASVMAAAANSQPALVAAAALGIPVSLPAGSLKFATGNGGAFAGGGIQNGGGGGGKGRWRTATAAIGDRNRTPVCATVV